MFSWNQKSQLSSVSFFQSNLSVYQPLLHLVHRSNQRKRRAAATESGFHFFLIKKMKISLILGSVMALIEAVRRLPTGVWCDVCRFAAAAASLSAAPPPPPLLLFWQLADDNRWGALITSSQRKMNSYPASSPAAFSIREAGS